MLTRLIGQMMAVIRRHVTRAPGVRETILAARAAAANGKLRVALDTCQRAIETGYEAPELIEEFAGLLLVDRQFDRAALNARRVLRVTPGAEDSWRIYSASMARLQLHDEARAFLSELLKRNPPRSLPAGGVGAALREGLIDASAALPVLREWERCATRSASVHRDLGLALERSGQFESALASYSSALELDPDDLLASYHRSLCLLVLGRFKEAWPGYELRLAGSGFSVMRALARTWWAGEDARNLRIFAMPEQGLGDEIMFCAFIPDLATVCASCVVGCDPRLETLFRRSFPMVQVTAVRPFQRDALAAAAGRVDRIVAIGSLPQHFPGHRSLGKAGAAYLRAAPERVRHWRDRLGSADRGIRIGLSWRGGTPRSGRERRSIPLCEFAGLLNIPGVTVVSVQYGDHEAEIGQLERDHGVRLENFPEAHDSCDELAALIQSLDVVVSVCNTTVHLAGALGQRVLVMVPSVPEWRYGAEGERLFWYENVRLFRQHASGEWGPVIDAICAELRRWPTTNSGSRAVGHAPG